MQNRKMRYLVTSRAFDLKTLTGPYFYIHLTESKYRLNTTYFDESVFEINPSPAPMAVKSRHI